MPCHTPPVKVRCRLPGWSKFHVKVLGTGKHARACGLDLFVNVTGDLVINRIWVISDFKGPGKDRTLPGPATIGHAALVGFDQRKARGWNS